MFQKLSLLITFSLGSKLKISLYIYFGDICTWAIIIYIGKNICEFNDKSVFNFVRYLKTKTNNVYKHYTAINYIRIT